MTWFDEVDQLLDQVTEVFGADITVTTITPGSFNSTTGVRAETTASVTVKANRIPIIQEHTGVGEGRALVEEYMYEIQSSLLQKPNPRTSRITDGSITCEIVTIDWDCERKNYIIRARRTA